MKWTIVFLAFVGCVFAYSVPTTKHVKVADKEFLLRQKFLFEILHRIEDPLMFEEYIKYGDKLIVDKTQYKVYDIYMEKFYEAYKLGNLLSKGEFFGALVKTHYLQARGLYNFFYYAHSWDVFVRNVCWARIHANEHLFVYALSLAVIHRPDTDGLILPQIYEIFPQLFFHSKLVYQAEKFDYDNYNRLMVYQKQYKDILNKHYGGQKYSQLKDVKEWQWWTLMGLDERFYVEDKCVLRGNIIDYLKDPKYLEIMGDTKLYYYPVDYTRDIDIYNKESKLSYFTEDLGWNAYWYYFNLDYAFFLPGKEYNLDKDRRSELWIYTVQQILARYYLERLSNGLGEIPDFHWYKQIEDGYDSQLVYYNGVGYSYRKNYYDHYSTCNSEMLVQLQNFFSIVKKAIEARFYQNTDGTIVDLTIPDTLKNIGHYLQNNADTYNKFYGNYYNLLLHMFFADVDYDQYEVYPDVLLNYETMLRDPFFYLLYKKFTNIYYQYKHILKPYEREELIYRGVEIKDIKVDELVTYFDLVDFDITNLLNDKMTFVDGEYIWDKTLLARQARLNHKPFTFEITVDSDKVQEGVVRVYLGPKYDENGRTIPLEYNRENFVQLDEFVYPFVAGKNIIKRSSYEFYKTAVDRLTYTELYKYVMYASAGKYDLPYDISEPHSAFPDRLILPRGTVDGLPMQLFFIVSPRKESYEQFGNYDYTYSSGIGSGTRFADSRAYGYPLDRTIDEYNFYVPNIYFKDVKIYHHDKFDKYREYRYTNYGKFDYEEYQKIVY